MKDPKIKDRIENAIDAFFANDFHSDDSQIVQYNKSSALLEIQNESGTTFQFDSTIKLVKLLFLFLPGSFFLFKVPMVFAYIEMFFNSMHIRLYEYYFVDFLIENSFFGLFLFLSACVMAFIGIGDIKKTKNLIVPGLIISVSVILFGVFSFLPEPFRGKVIQYYSTFLYPMVLVGVWFVKSWIEEKSEN